MQAPGRHHAQTCESHVPYARALLHPKPTAGQMLLLSKYIHLTKMQQSWNHYLAHQQLII